MSLRQLQVASLRKLARQVASSATTMRRKTQSIRATGSYRPVHDIVCSYIGMHGPEECVVEEEEERG